LLRLLPLLPLNPRLGELLQPSRVLLTGPAWFLLSNFYFLILTFIRQSAAPT